jgi:hypothetical protein
LVHTELDGHWLQPSIRLLQLLQTPPLSAVPLEHWQPVPLGVNPLAASHVVQDEAVVQTAQPAKQGAQLTPAS